MVMPKFILAAIGVVLVGLLAGSLALPIIEHPASRSAASHQMYYLSPLPIPTPEPSAIPTVTTPPSPSAMVTPRLQHSPRHSATRQLPKSVAATPSRPEETDLFSPGGPACDDASMMRLLHPRIIVTLGDHLLTLMDGAEIVLQAPVRTGREHDPNHRTPRGHGSVTSRLQITWNPIWRPGPSARREATARGEHLESEEASYLGDGFAPPNPKNGLGVAKIKLTGHWPSGFLLHGTNATERSQVGTDASLMCVGLPNEEMEYLICFLLPTLDSGTQVPVDITGGNFATGGHNID